MAASSSSSFKSVRSSPFMRPFWSCLESRAKFLKVQSALPRFGSVLWLVYIPPPATRYFDRMDKCTHPGVPLTPSLWRNLDTQRKAFSKTFIHVATMSCLDTHFIKTSFIDAAGKELLKISELVNTKFQSDTLKASEAKNRENLQTLVCTIQTYVRLSDFGELLYIFVSFQQI